MARKVLAGGVSLEGSSFERWVIEAFDEFEPAKSDGYRLLLNQKPKEQESQTDAVGGGGGKFPDLFLEKNSQRVFIECKGTRGTQDLQLNSTPPSGVHIEKDNYYRTFYAIGSTAQGRVTRTCLVDGYYFDSNPDLQHQVRDLVSDSIRGAVHARYPAWGFEGEYRGRKSDPYLTKLSSYSVDPDFWVRVRRMYHATNPLRTFQTPDLFAILPSDLLPTVLLHESVDKPKIAGIKLSLGDQSISRRERGGEQREFSLLFVKASA